jgi:hypothetical protein
MCASIVAGVDTSPVLEPSKHVFDFVTLAIELFIVWYGLFTIGFRRDAGIDFSLGEGFPEPVRIIAPVRQKFFGLWQVGQYRLCALEVAHLTFTQQHDQRPTQAIANGVQF